MSEGVKLKLKVKSKTLAGALKKLKVLNSQAKKAKK
jgi:hypothetical protein